MKTTMYALPTGYISADLREKYLLNLYQFDKVANNLRKGIGVLEELLC